MMMMMRKSKLQIKMMICLDLIMLLMTGQSLAFKIWKSNSKTHHDITKDAILQTTIDVCKFIAEKEGKDFVMPSLLTVESVAKACDSETSIFFYASIYTITLSNSFIDSHVLDGRYHFDNEEFLPGHQIIKEGLSAVKDNVKDQSYLTARVKLGNILHTLQDFYSHSNWIEMKKTTPYSDLINPIPNFNIADSETCRKCDGDVCVGNILEEVNKQQKLTSGYFGISKPPGKCSHGGLVDFTSYGFGGINKDDVDSSHGYLHQSAALVATEASKELLQNIRAVVGDAQFLRLMGIKQTSVLCFVIDTTGSMSDDIAEVRRVTSSIIDSKTGSTSPPSEYILVTFNDPDYGPLTRTTDPDVFKQQLNALTADGGGDRPEMCLSGLMLALTGAPMRTEIFVFTDADAKDYYLKSSAKALIEITKSKVNFMLTNAFETRRKKRAVSNNGQQQFSPRLLNPLNQVYQDLAQASGGQAIEVTKDTLPMATDIIAVTSRATLVTLFQAVRNPAKAENFSAVVDSSVQNLTIYITGISPDYTITSPSGVSQNSTELNGTLGLIQEVGNFYTLQPNISDQTGTWFINISSTQPYTVKVVGLSQVDFFFDFVQLSNGLHPSFAVLNSRPATNTNVTLLVTMIGGGSVRPTDVSLVEASSSNSFNGTLEEVASNQYLVTINRIPAGEFTVNVIGQFTWSRSSNNIFQRQSPTQFQTSNVNITTQTVGTLEPGKQATLPFTVATNGSGGIFTISVSNDRSFDTSFNTSITVESGGSANSTVTVNVPENTPSGTDVTVTIEAAAPDGSDSNYAVLRLAVIAPKTDFTAPLCNAVSMNANCSGNCSLSWWYLTANVTDGNGTGIQIIRVLQGNGNLTTNTVNDTGVNVTMVSYNASCCSQDLELVAVDEAGNVGTCFKSVRATAPSSTFAPAVASTNTTATTVVTNSNGAECCLLLPVIFWLNVGVVFYQLMQL